MPVELPPPVPKCPQCQIEFTDTGLYPNDENLTIGYNGFARLGPQGDRALINCVDVSGKVVIAEQFAAGNGSVRGIQTAGT